MDVFHQILEQYWGFTEFRPLQEEIIHSIYEGKDTLGLMPTGGGKSLTFQVPAMAMDGICIVVTPLIALMRDQVQNLRKLGIKATAVYSGMRRDEIIKELENCIFGDYKFLYVSPERLGTEIFLAKMQAMTVCMLVVDESHCISQWGYDFRPSYMMIADIREHLPGVPVLALTATATPEVVDDIQERLHFKEKNVFKKSFVRKNLAYIVRRTDDKLNMLLYILGKVPGTAIVYVRSRKRTKEIAQALQQAGITADFYHAGLERESKEAKQNRWKSGECRVIVATNAFGMGIDKPDVRLVVHIDMPGSLEEYFQEAGRGGRDGEKAYAVALCADSDQATLKRRIAEEFPEKEFIKHVYEVLGNYYQIAVGFGAETVHEFSLMDFCSIYKLPMIQTHHALKLLELAGYIEYTEEQENNSKLMFICTREELYQTNLPVEKSDEVIQTLLRSYTGLFVDYAYIDEKAISTRLNIDRNELYNILIDLSQYRIINYIPYKKTPLIVYTQRREEQDLVVIPKSVYEERKERYEKRIGRVLEYINDTQICRSRMLISYFGEKESNDCGCCDVCVAKNSSGLSNYDYNSIRKALVDKLKEQEPMAVKKMVESLPFQREKCLTVIRFLADHDPEFQLKDEQLSMITKN